MEKEIMKRVLSELERAERLHDFPLDIIHQVAIMAEKAGKSIMAANNLVYHTEKTLDGQCKARDELSEELIQTAAMCVRILGCMQNDKIRIRGDL